MLFEEKCSEWTLNQVQGDKNPLPLLAGATGEQSAKVFCEKNEFLCAKTVDTFNANLSRQRSRGEVEPKTYHSQPLNMEVYHA